MKFVIDGEEIEGCAIVCTIVKDSAFHCITKGDFSPLSLAAACLHSKELFEREVPVDMQGTAIALARLVREENEKDLGTLKYPSSSNDLIKKLMDF